MMQVQVRDHSKEALQTIRLSGWEAVRRVAHLFWQSVTLAVNVGNPRPYVTPSAPGEPPRKRTGWLQRHILPDYDQANLKARVGLVQNAFYGVFLEFGTARMAARPWLLATLKKALPQLKAIGEAVSPK